MTIGEIQSITAAGGPNEKSAALKGGAPQGTRNREIARAVREINEGGGVGPSSELRFAIDRDSGEALIRIVDRVTDEVITQIPPEAILRIAEMIKQMNAGDRFA